MDTQLQPCIVCLQRGCTDQDHLRETVETLRIDRTYRDGERFRWLANLRPHELIVTRNGENACNYRTAREWIEEHPEDFEDVLSDELERMKDTDSIWCVCVYPTGSVSSYSSHAATLTAAIDEMRKTLYLEYPNGIPARPAK